MAIFEGKYWFQSFHSIKKLFAGTRMGAGRALALFLFGVFLCVRVWDPPLVEELRKRSFDLLQVLDTRQPEHFPVIIVDVDEESLKAEGQWPWPRKTIAELIDKLNALGAAAIGFDIIFAEPDRYSPQTITKLVPEIDQQTRAMIDRLPTNDQLLAAAFRKGRVVVGQSGVRQIGNQNSGVVKKATIATIGADPLPFLVTF